MSRKAACDRMCPLANSPSTESSLDILIPPTTAGIPGFSYPGRLAAGEAHSLNQKLVGVRFWLTGRGVYHIRGSKVLATTSLARHRAPKSAQTSLNMSVVLRKRLNLS